VELVTNRQPFAFAVVDLAADELGVHHPRNWPRQHRALV
jgi:hypothetical protein